jgi:hypothetical protein
MRGRCGRDRMVVGFMTTYAISPLKLWVRISLRQYVLDTLLDSLSVTCRRSMVFSATSVSSTNKTDRHEYTI